MHPTLDAIAGCASHTVFPEIVQVVLGKSPNRKVRFAQINFGGYRVNQVLGGRDTSKPSMCDIEATPLRTHRIQNASSISSQLQRAQL